MKTLISIFLFFWAMIDIATGDEMMPTYLLIDDFKTDQSAIKTRWKGFTDRVMGGVSDMSVFRASDEEESFLRMRGHVSVENNGGFIQVRLSLSSQLRPFDGREYRGIRLKVRGTDSGYYIFLRTTTMIVPWKYYAAPITVTGDWQQVDIPWTAFKPGDYGTLGTLRLRNLKSLALVAYGKEFDASIDLSEIGLYK